MTVPGQRRLDRGLGLVADPTGLNSSTSRARERWAVHNMPRVAWRRKVKHG